MPVQFKRQLPTKRQLGINYLAGVGVALSICVIAYLAYSYEPIPIVGINGFIALALFATIGYLGYLFLELKLSDDFVWTVALWTALGFGISTLMSLGIGFSEPYLPDGVISPSLLVITIASGGIIGTLFGVISGLRNQHQRIRTLTQRNSVMNRVLRHNIRNDMNVILGKANLLREDDHPKESVIDAIERTTVEVIRLSEAAKHIGKFTTNMDGQAVNATRATTSVVENIIEKYPFAEIQIESPEDVWVKASPLLQFVLQHLIENAIEHNDTEPDIRISINYTGATKEAVEYRVIDNGLGIPASELEILYQDREEPLDHGNGLGLWVVKWFVEQYGDNLSFETQTPRGSAVSFTLPTTDQLDNSPTIFNGLRTLLPVDIL